jgi:hypothetical protein
MQHLIYSITFIVDTNHHPLANSGCLGRIFGGKKQTAGVVDRNLVR